MACGPETGAGTLFQLVKIRRRLLQPCIPFGIGLPTVCDLEKGRLETPGDQHDLYHFQIVILTQHLPIEVFANRGSSVEEQDKRKQHLHHSFYRLINCSRTPRAELRFVPMASLAERKLMIPSERRSPVPNCHSNCGAEAISQS